MRRINRMMDDEELFSGMFGDDPAGAAPDQSIGRIGQSLMAEGRPAGPAAAGRLTLDQLSNTYDDQGNVWHVQDPNSAFTNMLAKAGYTGNAFDKGSRSVMQGDSGMVQEDTFTPSAGAMAALKDYSYAPRQDGSTNYVDAYNPQGQAQGSYKWGEKITGKDVLQDAARIAAIAGGINFASGGFGGLFGEAASGGLSAGAVDSAAAGLDSGLFGGSSGFGGGLSAGAVDSAAMGLDAAGGAASQSAPSWLSSVPSEVEASIQQAAMQSPAQVVALAPDIASIPVSAGASGVDQFRQQEMAGYQTNGALPSSPASTVAPSAPQESGLNQFRQQELAGYQSDGSLPTSPAVPTGTGGLMGSLKSAGGGALDWMKANPGLAKLMLGGATSLLSSQGGQSAAPRTYGPAVKWNSPVAGIPQGLLGGGQPSQSGGQSGYPQAMGLLGGQPNSGAWRFLR